MVKQESCSAESWCIEVHVYEVTESFLEIQFRSWLSKFQTVGALNSRNWDQLNNQFANYRIPLRHHVDLAFSVFSKASFGNSGTVGVITTKVSSRGYQSFPHSWTTNMCSMLRARVDRAKLRPLISSHGFSGPMQCNASERNRFGHKELLVLYDTSQIWDCQL